MYVACAYLPGAFICAHLCREKRGRHRCSPQSHPATPLKEEREEPVNKEANP